MHPLQGDTFSEFRAAARDQASGRLDTPSLLLQLRAVPIEGRPLWRAYPSNSSSELPVFFVF